MMDEYVEIEELVHVEVALDDAFLGQEMIVCERYKYEEGMEKGEDEWRRRRMSSRMGKVGGWGLDTKDRTLLVFSALDLAEPEFEPEGELSKKEVDADEALDEYSCRVIQLLPV